MTQSHPSHTHPSGPSPHSHRHGRPSPDGKAPFWVRYYDLIGSLLTLGRTAKMHRQTLSLVDIRRGDAVLDVGCGTGKLLLQAAPLVGPQGTAVGLDVEPEMIRQARAHAAKSGSSARFEVASIAQIPYAQGSFDVVLSTLMFHHLSPPDQAAGLSEAARVLKPGGRFLLVDMDPSRRSILTSLPGHAQVAHRNYVRDDVPPLMEASGLELVAVGAHPSRQLAYALARKPQ